MADVHFQTSLFVVADEMDHKTSLHFHQVGLDNAKQSSDKELEGIAHENFGMPPHVCFVEAAMVCICAGQTRKGLPTA